jgi:hypothetical protein
VRLLKDIFRGGFFKLIYEVFIKRKRLFEDISREIETFVKKCQAFIKISIILENFFREIQAFSKRSEAFFAMSLWP